MGRTHIKFDSPARARVESAFGLFFNHLETVRWLLENGGKPSLRKRNAMGLTPAALAKNTSHGEVLKLLEEAEAAAESE